MSVSTSKTQNIQVNTKVCHLNSGYGKQFVFDIYCLAVDKLHQDIRNSNSLLFQAVYIETRHNLNGNLLIFEFRGDKTNTPHPMIHRVSCFMSFKIVGTLLPVFPPFVALIEHYYFPSN